MPELLSWSILLLPLCSAAVIQLLLREMAGIAVRMSVGSVATTFVIALVLLGSEDRTLAVQWATAGSFHIEVGLILDDLSRCEPVAVTFVSYERTQFFN